MTDPTRVAEVTLRPDYERMGQLPLSLEDLKNLARAHLADEQRLQELEEQKRQLESVLAWIGANTTEAEIHHSALHALSITGAEPDA